MRYAAVGIIVLLAFTAKAQEAPPCDSSTFESMVTYHEEPLLIVARCRAYLTGSDVDRDGTIRWLAVQGKAAVLEVLVEMGWELEPKEGHGLLFYALGAARDPAEMLQFLIAKGVDVSEATRESDIVYYAIELGHVKSLEVLLDALPDKNALYASRNIFAAISSNNMELLRRILAHGADPNVRLDRHGYTPIMMAIAQNADVAFVRLLVRAGADCRARSDRGETASSLARDRGDSKLSRVVEACMSD